MHGFGGDEDRATAERYLRLLAREPDSLRFAEYADRLRCMERLAEATALCAQGLARHPTYATGHVVMAEILLEAGVPERAEAELQEALRLDPCHPRAHLALGEMLLTQGLTERAVAEFETALLYSPGLPEAQARLAEVKGPAPEPSRPSSAAGETPTWTPGERPRWLTADREGDLLGRIAACPSAGSSALARQDGTMAAGSKRPVLREDGACAEVGFIAEARALVSRLGAGRLRSALICGNHNRTLCLPLGDLLAIVDLRPGSSVDAGVRQVEAAIGASPGVGKVASDV